jgi:hypothetical protein
LFGGKTAVGDSRGGRRRLIAGTPTVHAALPKRTISSVGVLRRLKTDLAAGRLDAESAKVLGKIRGLR